MCRKIRSFENMPFGIFSPLVTVKKKKNLVGNNLII